MPASTAHTLRLRVASDCWLDDYLAFIDTLEVNSAQRSQRRYAGGRFVKRHGYVSLWMTRPTRARLADLPRLKAWPMLTWLFVQRPGAPA